MATDIEHDHERMKQTLLHVRKSLYRIHIRIMDGDGLPDKFPELLCLEIDICLSLNEYEGGKDENL